LGRSSAAVAKLAGPPIEDMFGVEPLIGPTLGGV
jgi:hypothetical protein